MVDNVARLTVSGTMDALPEVRQFVTIMARRAALDERGIYHCQMATEEIFTNIIEHGYEMNGDQRSIEMLCEIIDGHFVMTIADDSAPFNPLEMENPDPTAPLENRRVGGWGIYFVKNLMDDVQYQYTQNRNVLRMVKHVRSTDADTAQKDPADSTVVKTVGDGQFVIVPQVAMDDSVSRQVETLLLKELAAGHRYLILDMTLVDDISGGGLKMLVSCWQRARELKGDIVLARLSPEVRDIMGVVGFDLMFTIYDSVEKAAKRIDP